MKSAVAAPILAGIALLVLVALSEPRPVHAEDMLIFLDEPMEPYSQGEIGGKATGGISSDILAGVFNRMGLKFEIHLVPWARAMKTIEFGQADGIPLLMKTTERKAFLVFSDPVIENRELFYFLPERLGNFQWTNFQDIRGLKVGLVTGYTYSNEFMRAVDEQQNEILYSQDSEANLCLLLAGRVDLILDDETLVKPLLADNPERASRVRTADKPVSNYYWHMGISRLSPLADRVDEINQALDQMRKDGSLKAILNAR